MANNNSPQAAPRILQQINEWKKRLIDLSRRNPLVYFKTDRKTILKVEAPIPLDLFKTLFEDKSCQVYLPPVPEDEEITTPKEGEIVFALTERAETEKRLKNIYRKAESDFQEKGIRTSILTFGLLNWKDGEEIASAPLILYPVTISRATPESPYVIEESDEDISLNPAIQVKFKTEFNIELIQPKLEDEDFNLESYFAEVEAQLARVQWKVERSCFLGNFSFHKMAMYADLDANAASIALHPIIKALTDRHVETPLGNGELPTDDERTLPAKPPELYILDADSSQAQAIESAIAGHSFVLKGPPGTGKSQTISNIIAKAIQHDKRVLFVSEKMAALEVVYSRLSNAGLKDYCLELHSHKANKREVIRELTRCLEEVPESNRQMTSSDKARLKSLRDRLNNYVLELHKKREPLYESAFNVLNHLIKLGAFPERSLKLPFTKCTPEHLNELLDIGAILRENYVVLAEGNNFPWRGYKGKDEDREIILGKLERLIDDIEEVISIFDAISGRLGIPSPKSFDGCREFISICEKLAENPSPELSWLLSPDSEKMLTEARECSKATENLQKISAELSVNYSKDFFDLPEDFINRFRALKGELFARVAKAEKADASIISATPVILESVNALHVALESASKGGSKILKSLDVQYSGDLSLHKIRQSIRLSEIALSHERLIPSWTKRSNLEKSEKEFNIFSDKLRHYREIVTDIRTKYTEAIFEADVDALCFNFKTKYLGWEKYFLLSYYKDLIFIHRCNKSSGIPATLRQDLESLRELILLKQEIHANNDRLVSLFDKYFSGIDTNLVALEKAIYNAKVAYTLSNIFQFGDSTYKLLTAELPLPQDFEPTSDRLTSDSDKVTNEIEKWNELFSWEKIIQGAGTIETSSVNKFLQALTKLNTIIEDFHRLTDRISALRVAPADASISSILDDLNKLETKRQTESFFKTNTASHAEKFKQRYSGMDTDWPMLVSALDWTVNLASPAYREYLDEEFFEAVAGGLQVPKEESLQLKDSLKQIRKNIDGFEGEHITPGAGVVMSGLDDARALMRLRQHRIDDITTWITYLSASERLANFSPGGTKVLEHITSTPPGAENIIPILTKGFYLSWLDGLKERCPIMAEFQGYNHERAITEFRDLDLKLTNLAFTEVISKLNESRREMYQGLRGGELSVLHDQAARKRGHYSLRKLFSRIPNLLLKIKPCLLMSPLSVSHFIGKDSFNFDIIIFDEASQICSEDAVGAISRGTQLVVAGDEKQLPPTKFFQGDVDGEEDWADSDEDFGVYQSVLEDCDSIGLTPKPLMLKWHYRSKHESLIAYSNESFYDHKLVTFPSSTENDPEFGVKFCYVANGLYDRGGNKTNLPEAKKVVELVFKHLKDHGADKTLGVATLNIQQRDLILDLIEEERKNNPEFNKYFTEDRLSGFFVKNLESVQGDERDVIILSLGYGRDANGKFTMNFGPINKTGGEKRLNVIVTRAKSKICLVTSIKASDFDIEKLTAPGLKSLYRYLDYAERGKNALESITLGPGETESPFEDDVKLEIEKMGYKAVCQVGCSGFRIDLGVIDPKNPGRYILGVECDGATYHRAFTARERDRIRQTILEGLGWRIYRIWSPDWFQSRDKEIARLQQAIKNAALGILPPARRPDAPVVITHKKIKIDHYTESDTIKDYVAFTPQRIHPKLDFITDDLRRERYLQEILATEGPMHVDVFTERLLSCWDIRRRGNNVSEAVSKTISRARSKGLVYAKNSFLYNNPRHDVEVVRKPVPQVAESLRSAEHVAPEEIQLAALFLVKSAMSISREELVDGVARLFGWQRTGHIVEGTIERALSVLIKDSEIVVNAEGIISALMGG